MKVLFVSDTVWFAGRPSARGGIISNAVLLRLLARRHAVTVVVVDPHLETGRHDLDGMTVINQPVVRRGDPFTRMLRLRRGLERGVRELVRSEGAPDLAIGSSLGVPALCESGDAARVILVRAYEEFGWRAPGLGLGERIKKSARRLVLGLGLLRAIATSRAVWTNSAYMRERIVRMWRHRSVRVLYPVIDLVSENGPASSRDESQRSPDGRAEAPFTIGFVGRSRAKNRPFVEALAAALPDVHFRIFGDTKGPALDNVEAMGFWSDRVAMYRSADCWVVPSKWPEPFGRVGAEALACGRVAVVARRGGLPEAVGVDALAVDELTVDAWRRRIEWVRRGGPDVAAAVAAGRRHVQQFSEPAQADVVHGEVERLFAVEGSR